MPLMGPCKGLTTTIKLSPLVGLSTIPDQGFKQSTNCIPKVKLNTKNADYAASHQNIPRPSIRKDQTGEPDGNKTCNSKL
eukprot:2975105-Ditylum_brightwellii.AAC.1